jgi:hypothetical protein
MRMRFLDGLRGGVVSDVSEGFRDGELFDWLGGGRSSFSNFASQTLLDVYASTGQTTGRYRY